MAVHEDSYEIYSSVDDFQRIQDELERRGVPVVAKQLAMMPQTYVQIPGDRVNQLLRLVEALEDHDDVQHVWMNVEVDEKVLAAQAR